MTHHTVYIRAAGRPDPTGMRAVPAGPAQHRAFLRCPHLRERERPRPPRGHPRCARVLRGSRPAAAPGSRSPRQHHLSSRRADGAVRRAGGRQFGGPMPPSPVPPAAASRSPCAGCARLGATRTPGAPHGKGRRPQPNAANRRFRCWPAAIALRASFANSTASSFTLVSPRTRFRDSLRWHSEASVRRPMHRGQVNNTERVDYLAVEIE